MTFIEKLKHLFNRDVEYITEYQEGEDLSVIPQEDRVVIGVTVAALAAGEKLSADYRIKSIRRIK